VSRIEAGKRDPSMILLLRWIEECDGRLDIATVETEQEIKPLSPAHRYILTRLNLLAPDLTSVMWTSLAALVDVWEKDVVKKTSST
jgi:hypothetical protein